MLAEVVGGVWRLTVGELTVNTYVVDAGSGKCIVVDPGDCSTVWKTIQDLDCRDGIVLITHGHFDHVAGVPCLQAAGYPIGGHPEAASWAVRFASWARSMGIDAKVEEFNVSLPLSDGSIVEVGRASLEAMYTPGHSPDHLIYIDRGRGIIFTGDLVFKGGVGRSDIPGGSPTMLAWSIERLLREAPTGSLLLPGHGPETTLDKEAGNLRSTISLLSRGTHEL